MRTSVSAKRCPECGKVAALQAQRCLGCGHQFRTYFEEPDDRTQAFDAVMLARPPALERPPARRAPRHGIGFAFGLAFWGSFCLVAAIGVLAWFGWNISQESARGHSPPMTYVSAPHIMRAEDLYNRVSLSMSLYDLDQTAGGLGRIIRSADPHTLLLSYDFSDQSVRVSLYRSDPAVDDYRVQAVALYHGSTLLHRHADDE